MPVVRSRFRQAALLAAAWSPFLLFWIYAAMQFGGEAFPLALRRAALTIGFAALPGLLVSRFCARNPWPSEIRARFVAAHFACGALYAAVWVVATFGADSLIRDLSLSRLLISPPAAWQFVMGLWLYGFIAGITYAILTQRRARENELRALRAEAGLTAARLDALRNRLHPHFLFNAFHTVSALVREDASRAETAIEKLGEILRYTLRDDGRDLVALREEWELTRRYLEFEQLRYESRLRVNADVTGDSLSCAVPPFALQTLVENAVRHAIAPRTEGGTIEISAHRQGTRLQVRVRDDGQGSEAPGTGQGLPTLRERLSAVYGDEAVLSWTMGTEGCEVTLDVPARAAAEDDDGL